MREIKFRVWDTKKNKYLDAIPPLEEWLDSDCWDDAEQLMEDPYIYPKNVTPDFDGRMIWQQYTGLKDKNGKEIYEGDILLYQSKSGLHERVHKMMVEWDNNQGRYDFNMLFPIRGYEVIGNIFENKDLIK